VARVADPPLHERRDTADRRFRSGVAARSVAAAIVWSRRELHEISCGQLHEISAVP